MDQANGPGTCSFCGFGDGCLGEQGDEMTQYLHGAVRHGEAPDWTYQQHPNAWGDPPQRVTWCGMCVGGLIHKFQRYDDTNLHAAHIAGQVRLELDGLRWSGWDEKKVREQPLGHADDPGIHLEKLALSRIVDDMQNEKFRRAGFDLTTRRWRP